MVCQNLLWLGSSSLYSWSSSTWSNSQSGPGQASGICWDCICKRKTCFIKGFEIFNKVTWTSWWIVYRKTAWRLLKAADHPSIVNLLDLWLLSSQDEGFPWIVNMDTDFVWNYMHFVTIWITRVAISSLSLLFMSQTHSHVRSHTLIKLSPTQIITTTKLF